jgi:hypothetical protein
MSDCNPMTYITVASIAGGKIFQMDSDFQEFDLEFIKSKSKKSLVFAELLCDLPFVVQR